MRFLLFFLLFSINILDLYNFFNRLYIFKFSNFFFSYFILLKFILFLDYIFFIFINSIFCDRDGEFFIKEILYNWLFYFIYFILLSLVIFINEDFDSSILEVFFDTFFITCFIFFFADFIIVGFKFFINRISLSLSNFILLLLPFLEIFSGLIKSFILSVRINTNYLSGHLLISIFFLVINFLLFSYYFSNIFFFALFLSFLYFLEVLVSFLQVYVLFILVLINVQDNNF